MRTPRLLAALAVMPLAALVGCAGDGGDDGAGLEPGRVTGKYVAVLCDADMQGTALADWRLGSRDGANGGAQDALTVLTLPIADPASPDAQRWKTAVTQVPVSNSALGPPMAVAASADGRWVYAVEVRGVAPPGATRIDELPDGTKLFAVDCADPARPRLAAAIDVGVRPMGVSVSPDGTMVAVAAHTPGMQIVVVKVNPGVGAGESPLGEVFRWELSSEAGADVRPSSIQWHPSGRYLALTLPRRGEVAFFEFSPTSETAGKPGLAPWGRAVPAGKYPYSGRFSKNGRHYLVADVQWGDDVEGYMTGAQQGTVSAIRLSGVESSVGVDGNIDLDGVRHAVVSTAVVGVSPEGLALSPSGRHVVTANIGRSHLPAGDATLTPGGSLSILSFDDESGALTLVGSATLTGMPKGVAFDAGGRSVVVSQFRAFDPAAADGELAIFGFTPSTGEAVFAGYYVAVGSGPHGMVIVR